MTLPGGWHDWKAPGSVGLTRRGVEGASLVVMPMKASPLDVETADIESRIWKRHPTQPAVYQQWTLHPARIYRGRNRVDRSASFFHWCSKTTVCVPVLVGIDELWGGLAEPDAVRATRAARLASCSRRSACYPGRPPRCARQRPHWLFGPALTLARRSSARIQGSSVIYPVRAARRRVVFSKKSSRTATFVHPWLSRPPVPLGAGRHPAVRPCCPRCCPGEFVSSPA